MSRVLDFLWRRRWLLVGLALMAAAVVQVERQSATNASTAAHLQGDDRQLLFGCERLGALIAVVNRDGAGDYAVLNSSGSQSAGAGGSFAVTINGQPALLTIKRASGSKLQQDALKEAAGAQAWIPPLNCVKLVRSHGGKYNLPAPVKFSKRPPPDSAFKVPAVSP